MPKAPAPQILTLSAGQLESVLLELRAALAPATYQMVEGLLKTLQWLMGVIQEKKASIARLKQMIFGAKTEKSARLFPEEAGSADADPNAAEKPPRRGHGRKKTKDYPGARRIPVCHPQLKIGSLCPKCLKGKLYRLKEPARLVRIMAQPIFSALVHELERLRCAVCGAVFTAPAPPEAGLGKYDPSVGVMLALMRYGAGLPMYRMDQWQTYLGVPLAASTQWELIKASSRTPELVYEALIVWGAQGQIIYSDDTTMRVQSLRREIVAEPEDTQRRTGIFTTSIVVRIGQNQIALFFTGRNHAGENLDRLLKNRAAELPAPIHMCDALSRNQPQGVKTISCNCLLHGRRNFLEVLESFPQECKKVVLSLREVYRWEALAKKRQFSDEERLAFHQAHSGPVMQELQQWMNDQLEQKKVQPNSGLGEAIRYMTKHWKSLTRFLEVPGAPLDNNTAERALKMAIRHRKNSLSYKTLTGARVGDIYMSLIHTCQLNKINPFEYLMALEEHSEAVMADPSRWVPWNYQQAIAASNSS